MRELFAPARADRLATTRLVLLPGAYQTLEEFAAQGFAEAVQRRRIAADISFVDVEFAHLTDRSALTLLQERIIAPARAAGCRSIWLGGISLGGYVSLQYAAERSHQQHAQIDAHIDAHIDGLCLLAPYLGNRMVIAEIARAGGLTTWSPDALASIDEERRIWRFIGTLHESRLSCHLGFGRDDRFAAAHALMATALPSRDVDVVAGGHDWPTWLRLWENFLDSRLRGSGP
jgi:pimeloyl-ACP methyl ester carboxylesterase